MLNYVVCIMSFLLTGCSNPVSDKSGANAVFSESPLKSSKNTVYNKTDSLINEKVKLAELYTQAIGEYIEAIYKKDKIKFDTLFLGRQAGIPDISLPATINGTEIRILSEAETTNKKSSYSQASPYINLIGFVESDKAAFIFVTFFPEFEHQYDCYLDLNYDSPKKEFVLDKCRIEVLMRNKAGQAERYAIYENGTYTGDKPVEGNKK